MQRLLLSYIILIVQVKLNSAELNGCANPITTNKDGTYYYFAYGSNMLPERIHLSSPTAIKVGSAKAKGYRFNFEQHNYRWEGLRSTIVPDENATTYGVVWKIDLSDLARLDDQEDVPVQTYFACNIPVTLLHANGTDLIARTYRLTEKPFDPQADPFPSKTYLQCIVKGAQEADLPKSYIRWLKSFNHTDKVVPKLEKELNLQTVDVDNWITEETEEGEPRFHAEEGTPQNHFFNE